MDAAGMEKSVNDNGEDVAGAEGLTPPVDLTSVDRAEDDAERADATGGQDSPDSASKETESIILESVDQGVKRDSNDSESDGDCNTESTCLEAMTCDGQKHYLRLGDSPRRRSALRLSRIIARQQLLRRLAQERL